MKPKESFWSHIFPWLFDFWNDSQSFRGIWGTRDQWSMTCQFCSCSQDIGRADVTPHSSASSKPWQPLYSLGIAVPSLWQLPLCARNQNLPNFLSSLFPVATPTLDSTSLGLRILPLPFVHLVLCVDHAEFYLRVKKDPHSFVSGKWLTANIPLCMT